MTCIAALVQDGAITMGGDSAGVAGLRLHVRSDPKVFRNGDFQVGELHDPFAAVGCGMDLAHGALYALRDSDLDPESKVRLALEAAERFSAGVRRPFVIERLEAKI